MLNDGTRIPVRHGAALWLVSAGVVFTAGSAVAGLAASSGVSLSSAAGWAVRLLPVFAAAGLAARLRGTSASFLILSPLFLLGVWASAFYSIALSAAEFIWIPHDAIREASSIESNRYAAFFYTRPFLGQAPELLVIQFSLFCLAATALCAAICLRAAPGNAEAEDSANPKPIATRPLILTSGILVALHIVALATPGFFESNGLLAEILAPLTSFGLASAALYEAKAGRRFPVLLLAALLGVCISMFALGAAKYAVFIPLAAALLYVAVRPVAFRDLLLIGPGLVVCLVAAMTIVHFHRTEAWGRTDAESHDPIRMAYLMLLAKGVTRQANSAYCFSHAFAESEQAAPSGSPFYFVSGLIPRVLWPDKPALSKGRYFAVRYCGNAAEGNTNDASILLLGEQFTVSGWSGFLIGELAIVGVLAVLSLAFLWIGPIGLAMTTALLPWAVDFDQNLAFWLANLVKSAVIALPFAIVLCLSTLRAPDRSTQQD